MQAKLTQLKKLLTRFFKNIFYVSKDTIDFFESNYGTCDPLKIKSIIEEDYSLVNLIINPDKHLVSKIQTLLSSDHLSSQDLNQLAYHLKNEIQNITISFTREKVSIPLNQNTILDFLQKLKLTSSLPPRIHKIIKELRADSYGDIIYHLKKADISWNENMVSFFEMFFIKFNNKELNLYLKILLQFFTPKATVKDIRDLLYKRLFQLKQVLSRSASVEDKIKSQGLEFVLISRIPILDLSPKELQREILILEELILNLFPDSALGE
jgi:hypothetical protein